jgi:hypothetical protein
MKKEQKCLICGINFEVDSESNKDKKTYIKVWRGEDGKYTGTRPSTTDELEESMKFGTIFKCQGCCKDGTNIYR